MMISDKLKKMWFYKKIIWVCAVIYILFFVYIMSRMIIHMITSIYFNFGIEVIFIWSCIFFGIVYFSSLLSYINKKIRQETYSVIPKPFLDQEQIPTKIFEINEYIYLKLINNITKIYINEKEFKQCKYLLLDIKIDEIEEYDEINSIDDVSERLDHQLESFSYSNIGITPEQEFQAHCSNIQTWVENNYDTRILHSNISFPLLRRLTELGDIKAKKVFKEEIVTRFVEGNKSVRTFLNNDNYLRYFSIEEILIIVRTVLEKEKSIDLSVTLNENIKNDLIFSREDIEDITGIWKVIN